MSPLARLAAWWRGPGDRDGLGQSLWTDLRWLLRFRRAARQAPGWRTPARAEAQRWEDHPVLGRFADTCCALAEMDGRRWIVLERDWWGWPDPPRYAWFALAPDGAVWAAADFTTWPGRWGALPALTTIPPP